MLLQNRDDLILAEPALAIVRLLSTDPSPQARAFQGQGHYPLIRSANSQHMQSAPLIIEDTDRPVCR
jgi:hypothetical protein